MNKQNINQEKQQMFSSFRKILRFSNLKANIDYYFIPRDWYNQWVDYIEDADIDDKPPPIGLFFSFSSCYYEILFIIPFVKFVQLQLFINKKDTSPLLCEHGRLKYSWDTKTHPNTDDNPFVLVKEGEYSLLNNLFVKHSSFYLKKSILFIRI